MVMALEKRIKRVFLKNKSKYLGSLFLIILGCIVYMVLNTTVVNLQKNLDSFINSSNREDAKAVIIRPIDNIEIIEKKFNVTLEGRRSFDYEVKNGVVLRIFDWSNKVNTPGVIKGKPIKDDNDILINPAFARIQKINIGDSIKIYNEEFNVTGYMSLPDYIYPTKLESDMVTDPSSFGIAVVSKDKMKQFNRGKETLNIKYNSSSSGKIKKYLDENYGLLFWQDIEDNSRYTMVKGEIRSLEEITLSIPIAIFILTCLLLASVIWRMVKMEFVEIGTLYALGYKRKEILKHYLTYPIMVSLIGALIGVGTSFFIVKPVLLFYTLYFNLPLMNINYRVSDIIAAFTIPIVFMTAAGAIVTLKALRKSPIKLMRGNGEKNKVGILEKHINLKKFKFKTKFKIRETLRSIPKILIIVFGISAASMLFLLGFAVQNSFDYLTNEGIKDSYRYNYNYVFKEPQFENKYGGEEYNISPFTLVDGEDDILVYGIKNNSSMISLRDKKGNTIEGNKITISKSLSQRLGIDIGDKIQLQNKLTDKKYSIKIDDICEIYIGNFIYMPLERFNKMIGLNDGGYTGIFSSNKLNIKEEILLKKENREDTLRAFDSFIKPIRYLLLGSGVISFLIALIILYIMISLIIEENKTSISMLKVLGYKDGEIGGMLLNTFNIPVIIGYIISIPLLYSSMGRVMESSMKEVDMTMPIIIKPMSIIVGFVIIYLTYELSKYLSRKKILSISMSESLKAQRE